MCVKNKIFKVINKLTGEEVRTLIGEYESIVLNQAITLTGLRPSEIELIDTGVLKQGCDCCGKAKE